MLFVTNQKRLNCRVRSYLANAGFIWFSSASCTVEPHQKCRISVTPPNIFSLNLKGARCVERTCFGASWKLSTLFIYLGDDRLLSPSRREIGVRGRVVKYYPGWVSESHHFEILSMPYEECNNFPSFFAVNLYLILQS